MTRSARPLLCVLVGVLGFAGASAAEPLPDSGWLERRHLSGDWGGWRRRLAERGVVPGARYTAGFWSNVRGGFATGTRYEGFAQWWIGADLERLLDWNGASFEIHWYSYHGGQPSEDLVGPFPTQTVSGWETSVSVRFYEIALTQSFLDGRLLLEAGQLAADSDFFVSEQAADLLNGTFGFLGLGRADSPFYPLAAPGAELLLRTADGLWELEAGVFTAAPGEDESSNFGFGWSFDNGAVFLAEFRARRRPFGRPGVYAFGVIGGTAKVENFRTGGTGRGAFGFYGMIDQRLVEQTGTRPGLGFFLRSYGGPYRQERNLDLWYVDLGLRLSRPLPGRDRDVLALGFAHLRLADAYVASRRAAGENVSRRESVLELTYRFQATGWLSLQPDLQLVFDPHFSRRDATVVGLRAVIDL